MLRTIKLNDDINWYFKKNPNALINGCAGSGRTFILNKLSDYLIDKGFITLRLGIENDLKNCISSKEEILNVIHELRNELSSRYLERSNNMSKECDKECIFLLIDDYDILMSKLDDNEKKELNSHLMNIIVQGKHVNIFTIITINQSDLNSIDYSFRNHFCLSAVLGNCKEVVYTNTFQQKIAPIDMSNVYTHDVFGIFYIKGANDIIDTFYLDCNNYINKSSSF